MPDDEPLADLPVSSGAGTGPDGTPGGQFPPVPACLVPGGEPGAAGLPSAPAESRPEPPLTPAGGAPEPSSAPLAGQAWRDKVKAAQSALAAEQRRGRGRYTPRRERPVKPRAGMNRRMPPPPGGAE